MPAPRSAATLTPPDRTAQAGRAHEVQSLFEGIADHYDQPAQAFGLLRYRAWHRQVAKRVAQARPQRVLDMCTGTGAIAAEVAARTPAAIVCADLTRGMLQQAIRRPTLAGGPIHFVQADAQAPPFPPQSFDAVVFSYLLRYVEDVPGTISALAALVRPGGVMVSLEFGVPEGRAARALWGFYVKRLLPAGLGRLSPGWRRVGGFLGGSIEDFERRWPVARQEAAWRAAGFRLDPTRRLSLGGGVLVSGTKAAPNQEGFSAPEAA